MCKIDELRKPIEIDKIDKIDNQNQAAYRLISVFIYLIDISISYSGLYTDVYLVSL